MFYLLWIYQRNRNTALMEHVQQQETIVASGFHNAMMIHTRECADKLLNLNGLMNNTSCTPSSQTRAQTPNELSGIWM
jgi:hypothetical protein